MTIFYVLWLMKEFIMLMVAFYLLLLSPFCYMIVYVDNKTKGLFNEEQGL